MEHSAGEISRRNFLKYGIYAVASVIFVGLAAPLIRYFFGPALRSAEGGEWIVAAQTSEIPIGRPTLVEYEQRKNDSWVVITQPKSAWVVTQDGQNFVVFVRMSPNMGHFGAGTGFAPA